MACALCDTAGQTHYALNPAGILITGSMTVEHTWAASAPGVTSAGNIEITVSATGVRLGNSAPLPSPECTNEVQGNRAARPSGVVVSVAGSMTWESGSHTFTDADLQTGWGAPDNGGVDNLTTPAFVQRPDYRPRTGFSIGPLHGWAQTYRDGPTANLTTILPIDGIVPPLSVGGGFGSAFRLDVQTGAYTFPAGYAPTPIPRLISNLRFRAHHPSHNFAEAGGTLDVSVPAFLLEDVAGAGFRDRLRLPAFSYTEANMSDPLPSGWTTNSVSVEWSDLLWEVDRVAACPEVLPP